MACINNNKPRFEWVERLDIILLREVHFQKPYQFKPGTKESAGCWTQVVTSLNTCYPNDDFSGQTVKSVRDHFNNIIKKREIVVRALEKESGVDVEETEIGNLVDEIIAERKDCLEQITVRKEEDKAAEESEKKKANDIRLKAMETLGETKKRTASDEDDSSKRKERKTGNDTLTFLSQRSEERKKDRQEEMEMRQKDLDSRNSQAEATSTAMLQMMKVMQDQMATQQEQAQRQHDMQHQQHQQTMLLFNSLIDKINNK